VNLHVESFVAGSGLSPTKAAALRDLIVQPAQPWFSHGERVYLEGALTGRFAAVTGDVFCTAWLDDEPVGNVTLCTARSAPQTGLISFVFTRPDQRGRGIAGLLMREAMARLRAGGGLCAHLGTDNPAARRVYTACGFHDYNGHIMRWLDPSGSDADFDSAYFADRGPAVVRPAHWGDMARAGYLYAAPHPWFQKDFCEKLYCGPDIVQTRIGSILPAMMLNAEAAGGTLLVMENAVGGIVGAATVSACAALLPETLLLDFLVAPAYAPQACMLLETAVAGPRGATSGRVAVVVASCDTEKAAIVRAAGFQLSTSAMPTLRQGKHSCDVDLYVRPAP